MDYESTGMTNNLLKTILHSNESNTNWPLQWTVHDSALNCWSSYLFKLLKVVRRKPLLKVVYSTKYLFTKGWHPQPCLSWMLSTSVFHDCVIIVGAYNESNQNIAVGILKLGWEPWWKPQIVIVFYWSKLKCIQSEPQNEMKEEKWATMMTSDFWDAMFNRSKK